MKHPDDLYLHVRPEHALHQELISSFSGKISEDFSKLLIDVFSYKPIVYHKESTEDQRIIKLSRYFYRDCYEPHSLLRGTIGCFVPTRTFLNEIFSSSFDINRNRIYYLIGGVGVGKTCFVNWFLSTQIRPLIENKKLWFIKIDMELLTLGQKFSFESLVAEIVKKTIRIITENAIASTASIFSALKNLEIAANSEKGPEFTDSVSRELIQLCQTINKEGFGRLFLVLDNLDYICHVNDKSLFHDDESTEEMPALKSIVSLIHNFGRSQALSTLGASILIVTRLDSFNMLSQIHKYSLPDADLGLNTFTLVPSDWRDVLKSRKKLITFAAENEPSGKEKEFIKIQSIIDEHLDETTLTSQRLSDDLIKLSNKGLRDIVEFFAQYSWMPKEKAIYTDTIIERFVNQWPVGMIAFLLNQRCLFSQKHSKFLNIYLHNIPSDSENPKNNRHEVYNVYWLNLLILLLLEKEIYFTPQQLFDIFSPKKGKKYNPVLVQYCFGILSDFIECNAIIVEREWNEARNDLRVKRVALSNRGKHFVKTAMYEKFYYLQLIVDDYFLPIPKCILPYYNYGENSYNYIVETDAAYNKRAKSMIAHKALQVLLFSYVLEESQEIEKEKYSTVFKRLTRYENITLPKVAYARTMIIEELDALNNSMGNFMKLDEIKKQAESLRQEIREQIQNAYDNKEEEK